MFVLFLLVRLHYHLNLSHRDMMFSENNNGIITLQLQPEIFVFLQFRVLRSNFINSFTRSLGVFLLFPLMDSRRHFLGILRGGWRESSGECPQQLTQSQTFAFSFTASPEISQENVSLLICGASCCCRCWCCISVCVCVCVLTVTDLIILRSWQTSGSWTFPLVCLRPWNFNDLYRVVH